jgi:hypothetical protein
MYVRVPIHGKVPIAASSPCVQLDFSPPVAGTVNDGVRTGMDTPFFSGSTVTVQV